jgi:hypothetical protein
MARIEKNSWLEVYKAIKTAVEKNTPLIIEGNFFPEQGREIKKLIWSDTIVVEIFCYARGITILKRYISRNRKGERHPGHRDYLWYPIVALEAFGMGFIKRYRPLKLTPNTLKVNTNNFASMDYESIRKFIISAG